ncbi:DUF2147 domain-containing protein [Entomospira nematocerorum]|uniref:DUF2147 domain-containing protein n=1 Tax=Entomospira nematocerorum TaxID=2719987 RepID=A0A968KU12_9SPIO|nr:DUF2147 domain-containing protein [Entomospira nematocera]NIZ46759.1 DUF2147 domain-containing protein [Entomospira nematocera]WDI33444.1 DUF2147 domain-containing protein [Entomospira nematocera]
MIKKMMGLVFLMCIGLSSAVAQSASDVTGLWFMYDLNAKSPSGIIQIYEYEGRIYGRTLLAYDADGTVHKHTDEEVDRARYLPGNPPTLGLDVIWGLTWNEKKNRYDDGHILDPRKKNPYNVQLHRDGDILKMRGSLGPFGATIDWTRATTADLDGLKSFSNPVPVVYYDEKGKLIRN